jgi:hypothetical protein
VTLVRHPKTPIDPPQVAPGLQGGIEGAPSPRHEHELEKNRSKKRKHRAKRTEGDSAIVATGRFQACIAADVDVFTMSNAAHAKPRYTGKLDKAEDFLLLTESSPARMAQLRRHGYQVILDDLAA